MNNPYLLLTPGPLSTSPTVKTAMLQDWCTWEADYNQIVQQIRQRLLDLAQADSKEYTAVLMQGSGTFGVEAVLGSVIPQDGVLAIFSNGTYGKRMEEMSAMLGLPHLYFEYAPDQIITAQQMEQALLEHPEITHIAFVHCETTTGILNPIEELAAVAKRNHKIVIVDAMSSFGGIPLPMQSTGIDFLISSANKCIQGVPGFCLIICRRDELIASQGRARSLSLNLFQQWKQMEEGQGKWRYTSPTHTVRAFYQALIELEEEGGVEQRYLRYKENHERLIAGMKKAGFKPYIRKEWQSPIITTFLYPEQFAFSFQHFYKYLRTQGFVIYPGKLTALEVFRIGNIGDVQPSQIDDLIHHVTHYVEEQIYEN